MNKSLQHTTSSVENKIVKDLQQKAYPLESVEDLDILMEYIGDAKYVLLGEASHGTHEYYTWRAELTKRLIIEKNFSFIAVEGDWPDCYQLNRYIKGYQDAETSAQKVLHAFNRWPTWMWANWEIVALAKWLHQYNKNLPIEKMIGFYGLDVYSLRESLDAILEYLAKTDTDAYTIAKDVALCFEPYEYEGVDYARSTRLIPETCEYEVLKLLKKILKEKSEYNTDHEAVLSTEQNAHVIFQAENYYRQMIRGGSESWNVRDKHMTNTLDRLMDFHGPKAKTIVWAHNTHIGDARATDMANSGMTNIGEMITKKHKADNVIKIGFGSYSGEVIAGSEWGAAMKKTSVPKGIQYSWEYLLHKAGHNNKLLLMDSFKNSSLSARLIDHRAIGVVYNPEHELYGNYVPSNLIGRYDAFIYIDKTSALHPLHIKPDGHQVPETYPWGV